MVLPFLEQNASIDFFPRELSTFSDVDERLSHRCWIVLLMLWLLFIIMLLMLPTLIKM